MIVALRGTLEHRDPQHGLVVDIGPVSLRVLVPASTLERVGAVGDRVQLYTYLHVRDDGLTLYGFHSEDARRMFEHLISVSGVGPPRALALLSVHSPGALARAILSEDVRALTQAPGVGQRNAKLIIAALKDRLEGEWGEVPGEPTPVAADGDVIAALMALGYSSVEARRAAGRLDEASQGEPLEERVRRALQGLAQ